MFLVDDVIASYDECTAYVTMKTDDMFDDLEMDDMELSRLLVETLLTDEMR
jgi:hypothetical protein